MDGESSQRLGDVVELVRGTTYSSSRLGDAGPVLLGLASIQRNGGFRTDNLKTYGGPSPSHLLLRPGDLYVSLKDVTQSADLLGSIARVPPEVQLGRLTQDTVKLKLKPGADPDMIYWTLRTPQYRSYCRAHATGTTNLGLPRSDFLAFPIPQLTSDRMALVKLLESIDARLDLNTRMATTLESMARALFQSWFVDFAPVRRKIEGRPIELPDHLALLFPNSFDGECPSGWTLSPLREQFRVLSGGTPSKSEAAYWGGDIPWVTPRAMAFSHVIEAADCVTPAAIGNGTRVAPAGSILIMVRGMGLHQGVRISQARRDVTFNQDVKALVPARLDSGFLLYALLDYQTALQAKVRAAGHGTGVLPTDALDDVRIPIPPEDVRERLFLPFGVINERVALARSQSRTLVAIRDMLLPKLISGRLQVIDAEQRIAAA